MPVFGTVPGSRIGVAIPWSYFVKVWKLRNPAGDGAEAKEPDEAMISAVRDEEVARIKKLVEPLPAKPS